MHVSFKIYYRNNLIDKKHSYLIPRPPSWDDRNCSYGHQLYPSDHVYHAKNDIDKYKCRFGKRFFKFEQKIFLQGNYVLQNQFTCNQ